MPSEIEQRILMLLRSDPDPMVPLSRLHAALVAELGPRCGTYAQLHERIRRRPDLFLLIEPLVPSWSDTAWSADLRDEYEHALRAAGVETGPRVALAARADTQPQPALARWAMDSPAAYGPAALPPGAAPVLRALQASLVQLWAAAADDPQLRAELVEALGQAEEIRRMLEAHDPAHAATSHPSPPAPPGEGE